MSMGQVREYLERRAMSVTEDFPMGFEQRMHDGHLNAVAVADLQG